LSLDAAFKSTKMSLHQILRPIKAAFWRQSQTTYRS